MVSKEEEDGKIRPNQTRVKESKRGNGKAALTSHQGAVKRVSAR